MPSAWQSIRALLLITVIPIALFAAFPVSAQSENASFFITDGGVPGRADGENRLFLADSFCDLQAYAAGFAERTWRAYLDGPDPRGQGEVRGRDRIGDGPWRNYRGTVIAADLDELHGEESNLTASTALTARGGPPPGDAPEIPPGPALDAALFSPDRPFLCFAAD